MTKAACFAKAGIVARDVVESVMRVTVDRTGRIAEASGESAAAHCQRMSRLP
jgi:hypothetical protein